MAQTVALLTDFGLVDPYVGQMKGALLTRAPQAVLVDLSHEVEPFNIAQAGFFLETSRRHFPPGTVFVAVVDPGVGGERRILCLEKDNQTILAPDNGLLGLVLEAPGPCNAFDMRRAFQNMESSATFHGRDLFAPLAARLVRGDSPQAMGTRVDADSLARLAWTAPHQTQEGLAAHVLHVDAFGNVVTNIPSDTWNTLADPPGPRLLLPARHDLAPVRTYGDLEQGAVGCLRGSQGFVELAMNQASAARRLDLQPGDTILLGTRP